MTEDADDGRQLQTIATAFEIVRELDVREGARLTDLATAFEMSDGTMHAYLNTLRTAGFVQQDGTEYSLSLEWFELGNRIRERDPLYQHGKAPADELAATTGELVYLAIEQRGTVYYIYPARGPEASEPATPIGTSRPIHAVAAGKALLAAMPASKRQQILESHSFDPITENTIIDRDVFRREVDRIAETGYALNDEEEFLGSRTVATSISDPAGGVAGAICVSGPTARFDDDYIDQIVPRLQETANQIEINFQRS